MTDKEVMQMALAALTEPHPGVRTDLSDAMIYREKIKTTAEALRAALAQPEPKPVAWMLTELDGTPLIDCGDLVVKQRPVLVSDKTDCIPLYTAPSQREWQGLTDDEVDEAEKEFGVWRGRVAKQSFESGAWWANEKLLEKNT